MKKLIRKFLILLPFLILHGSTFAADASNNNNPAGISSGSFARYVLGGVIVLLGFVIFILTNAIKIAGQNYQEKIKAERNSAGKILSIILILSIFSNSLFAQTEANTKNFASNWDLYILMIIVLVLFIAILAMVRTLFILMGIKAIEKEQKLDGPKEKTFFQKFNNTLPIEEEDSLDLSHDYDGIRELDNKIPSWWTWAFFSFVLFAIVYLYRMFVSETLPNQYVELAKANEIAAEQKLEFLKNSANNVDENSVVFLGAADIAQGAAVYAQNCVACHGDKGQGGVGPNLTDDYWLHKGGIKEIFYSIKYGWQEKGMKSWKDDFSPIQIAQLTSFVKTLHGTNPPMPKAQQGELYTEDTTKTMNADSTKAVTDSVKK